MTEHADVAAGLRFTGERFIPGEGGTEIALEHVHRYRAVAGLVTGMDVVDLGSGSGYGAALLASNRSYTGYDIAPDAVAFATSRFGGPTTRFEVGDVTSLSHADASADVVVCFEVLEHVEDPGSVVREARRILRRDGVFVSSTPDRTAYNRTRDEPNPFHLAEMEGDEYEQLLATCFVHARLHAQAYAPASWLLGSEDKSGEQRLTLLDVAMDGIGGKPGPLYWVGFASDAPLPSLVGSALLAGRDDTPELARAVSQLHAYEEELEARREALERADAREVVARAQLAAYEQTIQALQGRLDRDPS